MKVTLHQVADLKREWDELGPRPATERYPGRFLVAMGVLSAHEEERQRERLCATETEPTLTVGFGEQLRVQSTSVLLDAAFYLHPAGPDRCWVGRNPQCGMHIAESSVSDGHAVLDLDGDTLYVTDLGSTNGTRINFQVIPPQQATPVEMNSMVTFGRYTFWLLGLGDLVVVVQEAPPRGPALE